MESLKNAKKPNDEEKGKPDLDNFKLLESAALLHVNVIQYNLCSLSFLLLTSTRTNRLPLFPQPPGGLTKVRYQTEQGFLVYIKTIASLYCLNIHLSFRFGHHLINR